MAVIADADGGRGSSARWWPGLEAPARTTRMDPTVVRSVAEHLEGMLARLTDGSKGTPADLTEKSTMVVTNDSFGRWETASEVLGSYLEAHERMVECYQMLIDQLEMTANTLRVEATEFEEVDAEAASLLDDKVES